MELAGIAVSDGAAAELAVRLQAGQETRLAFRLGDAIDRLHESFPLTIRDREAVLRVLDDCPDDLLDLRAALVQEAVWREAQGL